MSKRTKLAIFIGAIAAVISAVVVVIVFWDKLLEKCPCRCKAEVELDGEETEEPEACEEVVTYTEEETADFADLGDAEEVTE